MFESVPYELSPGDSGVEPPGEVTFYGLSFCDHCAAGRSLLEELRIPFRIAYIDQLEPEVRRPVLKTFRELYGKSVMYPVLEIDGEYTFGYSREIWSDLLRSISQKT